MKQTQYTRGYKRYLAFDIHREYILVGGQDEDQAWTLAPRRVSIEKFPEWAQKNLHEGDIVVLETTTNVWETYDIIAPLVSRVLVAYAVAVGEIVGARVKTDKENIKRLLRLLFGGIVPEVWVPPAHVRELRAIIPYRNRLVKMATMIQNRLHAVLQRHHLLSPEGNPFQEAQNNWWLELPLGKLEKINLQSDLDTLRFAEMQLTRLTAIMTKITAENEEIAA